MGTLAEGIKEIFATAKTTGSNVMLCGNDGTPDGHMTMDNLASVLGMNNIYDIGYIGSESVFNEFIAHHVISSDDGKFSCRSCYYSGSSYFVLANYVTDLQFRVDYYNGKLEGRTYIADKESFSDWNEFTFKLP